MIERGGRGGKGMGCREVDLFSVVSRMCCGLCAEDVVAWDTSVLACMTMNTTRTRHRVKELRRVRREHQGHTKEAGHVLHLDLQLLFMWQIEERLALRYDILDQTIANPDVCDIEKADLEERITKRGEKIWFCFRVSSKSKVKDRDRLE